MRTALRFLSFGLFSVVVGATGGVMQRGERREEQGTLEFAIAWPGAGSPRIEVPER